MPVDLRSDTITRPSKPMLDFMFKAEVGDMVLDEDPTVNLLEEKISGLFGVDKALFSPSGTMSNQIAIKVNTQPGDDVICSNLAHIYQYEGGGIAFNSGASVTLIDSPNGIFSASDVIESIQPDDHHKPRTNLVSIENTVNRGGGAIWPVEAIKEISELCRQYKLAYHLDGARLFNALTQTGEDPKIYGQLFDTISICLSKGLGAPVGSVLLGSEELIRRAKRVRKVLGGTMRQAGYLAAAGIFALENNVQRLIDDHRNAMKLGSTLKNLSWVTHVNPVESNIVLFDTINSKPAEEIVNLLVEKGILSFALGKNTIRFVTHLEISDEDTEEAITILKQLEV